MQTTGDALFQAIIDKPDADGLRLVYADWLHDHGEPDRAEFIRLEIAIHSRLFGPDGLCGLLAGSLPVRLELLALIDCALGDAGATALAECPALADLRAVWLQGNGITDAGAFALANSPHLASLRHLPLYNNPIGERGQAALRERFGPVVQF
jgi:uncharacterized protein (TIGR02996 family)